jgi:hypothetical protein
MILVFSVVLQWATVCLKSSAESRVHAFEIQKT